MKKHNYPATAFLHVYLSVVQILMKLADTTFLYGELGRGSGKTTHILAPRIDRVQNDMPGALLVLAAATYKSIVDNILPGIIEYFQENYERGIYWEVGKKPPSHFAPCFTFVEDWKHTITFVTGTVIKFVSCDRPESMLGLNAAHLFVDEMIKIPKDKFVERIMPALRSDRSKFGHSHYFMGITGFSSTPNFETDESWWCAYEENMNPELIECIQELALEVDIRLAKKIIAEQEMNEREIKTLDKFLRNWMPRLNELRRGQTYYARASSFSNIKILGMEYIENQIKSIKDPDMLTTSIMAVRKHKVKEMFFGKFGKEHLFDDGYQYRELDKYTFGEKPEFTSRDLKYCNPKKPLIAGYDAGPFSSIIFAQEDKVKNEFRVIKDMWVFHPDQHEELAEKIDSFFQDHKRKEIFLYYDRAANQKNPEYRKYYPLNGTRKDSDANLLAQALKSRRWTVHLLSKGQETIYYSQHYRLLNKLFGKNDGKRPDILIDRNECEALVSSINHSPVKKTDGEVALDKSSEIKLEYSEQAYYSTQLSSAFMYMLWGKFNYLMPSSDRKQGMPFSGGTFTV